MAHRSQLMNISYNWLSDYVDIADLTPEAVAELLTMVGLEVDGLERHGTSLDGVIIGHVVQTRQHPDADRLTLCDVDLGDGEFVQIVCGAPNVAAGQKVPVATVGTTLMLPSRKDASVREPVTLAQVKIRGEVSNGMICAQDELGLGDDHSGIMVLDGDAPTGELFERYLRRKSALVADATLDVAITPNRPDATSHVGMARDVAAVTSRALCLPDVSVRPDGKTSGVAVRIEAPEACPRYVGLVVRGVKVGPSPDWMQRRLKAVGLRPINNVVDVTNYVMYEIGQPLHAFDLAQLAGDDQHQAVIVVRQTRGEERFTTLDDQERTLPPDTLLICDATRAVAVAGVMGGANSEVTEETTDLLIESAYFEPTGIRRTARALSLQTDSSYRFERGADPAIQAWAACRAAELIVKVAGGTIEDVLVDEHPLPHVSLEIEVRGDRINELLGTRIPATEIERLLTTIGFESGAIAGGWRVKVPSYRPDVEREVDVIEEVARLYGYDRIEQPGRMTLPSLPPRSDRERALRAMAVDRLAGLGFRELYTNSLLPAAQAQRFAMPVVTGARVDAVVTANPINREMAALRPSLLPGVLAAMAYNQNRDAGPLRLFEMGHVFGAAQDPDAPVDGYRERTSLLIAISGTAERGGWDRKPRQADFFDLKGLAAHLLQTLGIEDPQEISSTEPDELTTYRLFLEVEGQRIAVLARVADEVAERMDLRDTVHFAEIDWTRLAAILTSHPETRYTPISRFPAVERDLAVTVDSSAEVAPLFTTIRERGQPLLLDVELFDLYEGERIEAGRKSLAFSLRFGADRTLTDKVVDKQLRRIREGLEREHGARLRQ